MVKVRYSEVNTNWDGDQENAEKVKTIEIQYASECEQLCITVDIDEGDRYFAYWLDIKKVYKAIRIAIERKELDEENLLKDFDPGEV